MKYHAINRVLFRILLVNLLAQMCQECNSDYGSGKANKWEKRTFGSNMQQTDQIFLEKNKLCHLWLLSHTPTCQHQREVAEFGTSSNTKL
jgi:hypothetical protein